MNTRLRQAMLPLAALTLAAVASTPASAAPLPFSASYDGVAQVVEVVNPTGPVLRFQTTASGIGFFDLGNYFSTDVIDMSTGAGTGTNRFVAGNGDELFGSFDVQVIPTSVANIVNLLGQVTFTGGTGVFDGASGSAQFTGTGEFTSATEARAHFDFDGSISLVPEPTSWMMLSAGMVALVLRGLRRNGNEPAAAA